MQISNFSDMVKYVSKDNEYSELQDFILECQQVRKEFITEAKANYENISLRVQCENIILMYDQLIDYILTH